MLFEFNAALKPLLSEIGTSSLIFNMGCNVTDFLKNSSGYLSISSDSCKIQSGRSIILCKAPFTIFVQI